MHINIILKGMGIKMFLRSRITGSFEQGLERYTTSEIIAIMDKINYKIIKSNYCYKKNVIAIALPRNIYLLATLLTLLEDEISFLPIDINDINNRTKYMLENANIKTIITEKTYEPYFKNYQLILLDDIYNENFKYDIVCKKFGSQIAYVLYTSGTSGKPKAIQITRDGFNNFINGITDIIPLDGKKIACFTNVTFDIFFLETIFALYKNMTVVMADENENHNPRKMIDIIKKHQVDVIQMTPSRMKMIQAVDTNFQCLKNVLIIMLGGENFPINLLQNLQKFTTAKIFNMYGPTETTIWSTVSELTSKDRIDIGRPIMNTKVYIMDDITYKEVEKGEIGEICIAGKGLANKYLNEPELTQKAFRLSPVCKEERIFCTGDLGMIDEYGNILCLGRKDHQIKLHGFRIELEDIDTNISRIEGILDVASCYDDENEKLILFYTSDTELEEDILQERVKELLPRYMYPNIYQRVKYLPYTASGKIDRKSIMRNYREEINENKEIENTNGDMIHEITNIVIKYCKQELIITGNTKLDQIGLDSIEFIKFMIDLETMYSIEFEESKLDFASFDTLMDIVKYIEKQKVINRKGCCETGITDGCG